MEKKDKIQIDNFVVEYLTINEIEYIEVRTVSQSWAIRFDNTTMMYGFIEACLAEPDYKYTLQLIFTSFFSSTTLINADLHSKILEAVVNIITESELEESLNDEEELKEARDYDRMVDAMQTLDNMDKD